MTTKKQKISSKVKIEMSEPELQTICHDDIPSGVFFVGVVVGSGTKAKLFMKDNEYNIVNVTDQNFMDTYDLEFSNYRVVDVNITVI